MVVAVNFGKQGFLDDVSLLVSPWSSTVVGDLQASNLMLVPQGERNMSVFNLIIFWCIDTLWSTHSAVVLILTSSYICFNIIGRRNGREEEKKLIFQPCPMRRQSGQTWKLSSKPFRVSVNITLTIPEVIWYACKCCGIPFMLAIDAGKTSVADRVSLLF